VDFFSLIYLVLLKVLDNDKLEMHFFSIHYEVCTPADTERIHETEIMQIKNDVRLPLPEQGETR
jgi:hypothetical protein